MERRLPQLADRRQHARGGRRATDRPGRYPNLLIADSYAASRMACARYLNHFGFQVDEACDGLEAIARLQAAPPHAILIEDALPSVPAIGVSEWLAQQAHVGPIPFI